MTTTNFTDSLWSDLALFMSGLMFAAYYGWHTHTLVWGLWSASLVVGYGILVSGIVRGRIYAGNKPLSGIAGFFSAVFLLAFFTVHFGGFHWGHSQFLHLFFPVEVNGMSGTDMMTWPQYRQVMLEAWWFVVLALIAERRILSGDSSAIEPRDSGLSLMTPYRNVVRLHLLIFFFAFSQFAGLPAVLVYLVVYAVYFFPWSSLRARLTAPAPRPPV